MTARERVCITGMAGQVGGVLHEALRDDFELTAVGRRPVPGVRTVQADVRDADAIRPAFEGQDLVIHLAAFVDWPDAWDEILAANIAGTYNVLESARAAGVRRFIFASSLAVFGFYRDELRQFLEAHRPATGETKKRFVESLGRPRPDSLYGLSKVFGEDLCRLYADEHGMSCVCLRISNVTPDDTPQTRDPLGPFVMCRHQELLRAVRRSIELTRRPCFEVINLISDDYPGKS